MFSSLEAAKKQGDEKKGETRIKPGRSRRRGHRKSQGRWERKEEKAENKSDTEEEGEVKQRKGSARKWRTIMKEKNKKEQKLKVGAGGIGGREKVKGKARENEK